jgi:hypothetical protein
MVNVINDTLSLSKISPYVIGEVLEERRRRSDQRDSSHPFSSSSVAPIFKDCKISFFLNSQSEEINSKWYVLSL